MFDISIFNGMSIEEKYGNMLIMLKGLVERRKSYHHS